MHYQQNMDCLNSAKYLITYSNEDPGTQNSVNALFELVCPHPLFPFCLGRQSVAYNGRHSAFYTLAKQHPTEEWPARFVCRLPMMSTS